MALCGSVLGLGRFDISSQTFTPLSKLLADSTLNVDIEVWSVIVDPFNRLWMGSQDGLYRYDVEVNHLRYFTHQPDNPHSINKGTVIALFWDNQGRLWVSSYQ